jgi:DNA repair protein RadD
MISAITLRPHQVAAADAVEDAWRSGIKRPLVDACVSAGKSLMFAELARREIERGGRAIIVAHTRELVEQNADACRKLMPGVHVGLNAAALNERTWRAPVISAAIQSVYKYAHNFGPVTQLGGDEAHLWPHSESGMYRELARGFPYARIYGASGTVFRLQGGSLIEGEGAPFDRVVYRYSILDGIRDGYLCPAFSIGATEVVDPSKLRTRSGEYTAESSDAQMIAAMDNHIAQMVHHGSERRAWLVFEAGTKAAHAMARRMGEWGIATGLVLGETGAGERAQTIEAFRSGRLKVLVNVNALTTGFDVPQVDLLVMRRPTKSLGLYIQQVGRALRTIGGNIDASIAAGKADCSVLDFAGNIDRHGPLDFIRPKETKARLVSCETCGTRNAAAAARCWHCDALMTKLCPACLETISRGELDCPKCDYDMRRPDTAEEKTAKLLETPSGAALIAAYKTGAAREGGWLPVLRAWKAADDTAWVVAGEQQLILAGELARALSNVRWVKLGGFGVIVSVLVPNGRSQASAKQISADGSEIIVPLPAMVPQPVSA